MIFGLSQARQFELKYYKEGGPAFNDITPAPPPPGDNTIYLWIVGDSGKLLYANGLTGEILIDTAIYPDYNFTGVSNAGRMTWIVGYKRDEPDKWKGIILYNFAPDGNLSWKRISESLYDSLLPFLPYSFPTPFLDVKAVNEDIAWVSCGNGLVLKTQDKGRTWEGFIPAQSLYIKDKPYSWPSDWFWAVYASDENTCWVGGDNSGLLAYTKDGGKHWEYDFPGIFHLSPPDSSLVFFDIKRFTSKGISIAASKGKVLTYDGMEWNLFYPWDDSSQWVHGVYFCGGLRLVCCGTGGTIENHWSHKESREWFSKRYDLNSIFFIDRDDTMEVITVAGTNSAVLFSKWRPSGERVSPSEGMGSPRFYIYDIQNDQGWEVMGRWNGSDLNPPFEVWCDPASETDLTALDYKGRCIYRGLDHSFKYDTVLTGFKTAFVLRSKNSSGLSQDDTVYAIARDNKSPRRVEGIGGRIFGPEETPYLELEWDPISLKKDPTIAGYWVDSENYYVSHNSPLIRNRWVSTLPPGTDSIGVAVSAMDLSGNYSPWSDVVVITREGPAGCKNKNLSSPLRILSSNPSSPPIVFKLFLPALLRLRIRVYNPLGQVVASIIEGREGPGVYRKVWDGTDRRGHRLPAGIYFCRLEIGELKETRKLIILK